MQVKAFLFVSHSDLEMVLTAPQPVLVIISFSKENAFYKGL